MRSQDLGGRIIKVDHAGEHGAINIYSGQIFIARWTAPALLDELLEFLTHEKRHREIFAEELRRRGVRRCRSNVFCGIGGHLLGIITAIFGASAIAATTLAVERVVLRHLRQQLAQLESNDPHAVKAISAIIEDEQQHHDRSELLAKAGTFWPRVLMPVVSAATETVIWLGMRL